MRVFVSLFLVLFLIDGSVSFVDDLLSLFSSASFLSGFRNALANFVILLALAVYCCLGIDRRLPKRAFLPLIVYVLLVPFSSLLVPGLSGSHLYGLGMSALQVALIGLPLMLFNSKGRRTLTPPAELFEGPLFSLKHTLLFGATSLLMLPVALVLLTLLMANGLAAEYTAGFMRVGLGGISMAERVYQRDDRTIRLAGMIHIGEKNYYGGLMRAMDRGRTIVLAEGVSDHRQLLCSRPHYGRLAGYLGLSSQQETMQLKGRPISEQQLNAQAPRAGNGKDGPDPQTADILRADLDVSCFKPVTIQFLDTMGSYLQDNRPVLDGVLAFNTWVEEHITPQMQQELMDDILRRRNKELIRHLDSALDRYDTVVIPWGALHMQEIEQEVLKRGFSLKEERRRKSIDFVRMLFNKLF